MKLLFAAKKRRCFCLKINMNRPYFKVELAPATWLHLVVGTSPTPSASHRVTASGPVTVARYQPTGTSPTPSASHRVTASGPVTATGPKGR